MLTTLRSWNRPRVLPGAHDFTRSAPKVTLRIGVRDCGGHACTTDLHRSCPAAPLLVDRHIGTFFDISSEHDTPTAIFIVRRDRRHRLAEVCGFFHQHRRLQCMRTQAEGDPIGPWPGDGIGERSSAARKNTFFWLAKSLTGGQCWTGITGIATFSLDTSRGRVCANRRLPPSSWRRPRASCRDAPAGIDFSTASCQPCDRLGEGGSSAIAVDLSILISSAPWRNSPCPRPDRHPPLTNNSDAYPTSNVETIIV